PIKKYENSSIRNMKDVDTELSLLQIRVDNFERVIENQMKVLFDVANNIVAANIHRQNNFNQSNETMDTQNCLVINNLLFSKDK
ncbi:unnamed protein product, partial [Adineta steineri]